MRRRPIRDQTGALLARLLAWVGREPRRRRPDAEALASAERVMNELRTARRLWDVEYPSTAPPAQAGPDRFEGWLHSRSLDGEIAARLRDRWTSGRLEYEAEIVQVARVDAPAPATDRSASALPAAAPARFAVLAAKPDIHEPRQLHLLVNRIPTVDELRFRQTGVASVAERDGYVLHFACDLPGVLLQPKVGDLWRVTMEDGSHRMAVGPGVGGAGAVNRVRPDLAAVDVTLSTDSASYETNRLADQRQGTVTGRLAGELYVRFPELHQQQERAIGGHVARNSLAGTELARKQREQRRSWAQGSSGSPSTSARARTTRFPTGNAP
jgi:hypothetical protein